MQAFRGWTISVGLLLVVTAANAQGAGPQDASRSRYLAASDFSGPYADVPAGPAVPAPAYGPQGYGPAEYGPGYGPPLMPSREVYAVLRENGFSPLGAPRLRGLFYAISAIDRRGDDGRLVIDARDGRIVRFVPADRFSGYGDGYYGSPPRPPGAVPPKIASRVPQSVPKTAPSQKSIVDEKPLADKLAPAPAPVQQSAAVQSKPADVAPAAPTVAPVEAKPAAPVIEPTQPMPKVQDLE